MTSSERRSLSLKEDMWALIPPTVIAYRKREENAALRAGINCGEVATNWQDIFIYLFNKCIWPVNSNSCGFGQLTVKDSKLEFF